MCNFEKKFLLYFGQVFFKFSRFWVESDWHPLLYVEHPLPWEFLDSSLFYVFLLKFENKRAPSLLWYIVTQTAQLAVYLTGLSSDSESCTPDIDVASHQRQIPRTSQDMSDETRDYTTTAPCCVYWCETLSLYS